MTKRIPYCLTIMVLGFLSSNVNGAGTETPNNTLLGQGSGTSLGGAAVDNTFIGVNAGSSVTIADQNTFVGDSAGENNTDSFNTFIGAFAGRDNGGSNNTFVGNEAGKGNSGSNNTFIGEDAGIVNNSGSQNTFVGVDSGLSNTSGGNNTFIGETAGQLNTTGRRNTFVGEESGRDHTTGDDNTFIGENAGRGNLTGSANVFLGSDAGRTETGSNKLHIANSSTPLIYGEFDNKLVGIDGTLGIGTQMPSSTLHVRRLDGTAKVFVEETNPTVAPRTLFELANRGNTKFIINNTDAGVQWAFTNSGFDFRISRQGSGAVEMTVDNSGNLEVTGTSTATNHINSSSRTLKSGFSPVDSSTILDRVIRLPITTWEYIKPDSGNLHIGPMAEDFQTIFGLGDGKHISTVDTAGVTLAAIKGLKAEKDKELHERDEQIVQLQSELEELRGLVQKLISKNVVAVAN